MKRYRLYDLYDYYGIHLSKDTRIGEADTLEECAKIALAYCDDCDDECDIWIVPYNCEAKRYLSIDAENFFLNYGEICEEVQRA